MPWPEEVHGDEAEAGGFKMSCGPTRLSLSPRPPSHSAHHLPKEGREACGFSAHEGLRGLRAV